MAGVDEGSLQLDESVDIVITPRADLNVLWSGGERRQEQKAYIAVVEIDVIGYHNGILYYAFNYAFSISALPFDKVQ